MEELLNLIEKVRSELFTRANDRDLTDPVVVELSQELDRLLNEYHANIIQKEIAS
jgi:hypothetical protein